MFTKAWGVDALWPKFPLPPKPHSQNWKLPSPEMVHKILTHPYTGNKYLDKLIQYHYFIGFFIGLRPEKELVIINVDDVDLDDTENPTIKITEPKKHYFEKILPLEQQIAYSKVHKSFRNYIDTIRPKFAERSEKALLVDPEGHKWIRGKIIDGKRWNEDRLRHQLLNKYARQVWKPYYPYIMRHWCATARCVEWLDDPRCLIRVKNWMGHKKINQTEKYIELADTYNNQNSWLSRALKLRKYKTKGECSVDNKMT